MDRKRIAREIVEEAVVLLKNDSMLPFASGQRVSRQRGNTALYICRRNTLRAAASGVKGIQ